MQEQRQSGIVPGLKKLAGQTAIRYGQFVLLLATATYLSLVPKPGAVFEAASDKFLHVLCWSVLLVSLHWGLGRVRVHKGAAVALFAYSILVEAGQAWVPNRFFSGWDILANGLGILVGISLLFSYGRWSSKQRAA